MKDIERYEGMNGQSNSSFNLLHFPDRWADWLNFS